MLKWSNLSNRTNSALKLIVNSLKFKMLLSVCSIRYTVLFNRNFIHFAVIIILVVSGNKLTLAALFGTGGNAHESSWLLPSRESCQELLLCLPQDIHLHQICEFVFDIVNELAWILPITLCLINCKEQRFLMQRICVYPWERAVLAAALFPCYLWDFVSS